VTGGSGSAAGSGSATSGPSVPADEQTIPQPAVDDADVLAPIEVTNPLFPVSSQESVLLAGQVDGQPFRTEVTLLPETRVIEWQGHPVEVLVSQYVA
jgi:hypothetical protein